MVIDALNIQSKKEAIGNLSNMPTNLDSPKNADTPVNNPVIEIIILTIKVYFESSTRFLFCLKAYENNDKASIKYSDIDTTIMLCLKPIAVEGSPFGSIGYAIRIVPISADNKSERDASFANVLFNRKPIRSEKKKRKIL